LHDHSWLKIGEASTRNPKNRAILRQRGSIGLKELTRFGHTIAQDLRLLRSHEKRQEE
jgi:hypothetical protein